MKRLTVKQEYTSSISIVDGYLTSKSDGRLKSRNFNKKNKLSVIKKIQGRIKIMQIHQGLHYFYDISLFCYLKRFRIVDTEFAI